MKTVLSFKHLYAVMFSALIMLSCSDDDGGSDEPIVFDPPAVTIDITSGEFRVGQTIRVSAEFEASALLNSFTVDRDGDVIETINYPAGTTGEDDYDLEFEVDQALLGTTQVFTFTVTDSQGETDSETFTATISDVAPAYQIEDVDINGTSFKRLTGNVNFDETLDSGSLWLLNGEVEVDDLATLTIEPGTMVYAADENTILQVNIGGTLIADGTAAEPIVFNSVNAAPGQPEDPDDGDWVGVRFNGDDTPEGNSGILRYVRIENGGNGDEPLQLRQVGGATTVDFVQIHNGDDTGLRMRGGYVDVKHLVITKPGDHGVRYSDGWEGNGQFWVILTDEQETEALLGRDTDDSPRTSDAVLSNITVVGPFLTSDGAGDTDGVQLRDGAKGQFHNFIVTGFDDSFRNRSEDGDMVIQNSLVFGNGQAGDEDGLHSSIRDAYRSEENNNVEDEPITLADNFVGVSTTNPSDASTLGDFFDAVSQVGAVAIDNDWTLGWTVNFDGSPRN